MESNGAQGENLEGNQEGNSQKRLKLLDGGYVELKSGNLSQRQKGVAPIKSELVYPAQ